MSIQVYRSSFEITKWDLNDKDNALTEATWEKRPADAALPQRGTPGATIEWPESGMPSDYAEPAREGFEFAGWSTDKSAPAGGYIDGSDPQLSMPDGAPEEGKYTLYALWTPLEYSVVFDLAQNPAANEGPEGSETDASFDLCWSTVDDVRMVTALGSGRYQVSGFTMKCVEYDEATRTVRLPEPARTGYRFLGWVEADAASGVVVDGKDGYALNPVRLPQLGGTPVLTARWASAFGVTAPMSITFGDYDVTGAPGNPWLGDGGSSAGDDTTQSEEDDTAKDDREGYEAKGQAYFENTSWHESVKVVELSSERHPDAGEVLTTYDSKQATEAAVLGDGTAANPGERLLSLYPSASAPTDDKSSGVHFRLSDFLAEDDLGDAFIMAPKDEKGSELAISYGLNLSTDPVTGSANHGLVLPGDDYERKQIATVSYAFAVVDAAMADPIPESFYIRDGNRTYGLAYIKRAAEDLSANGTASEYYDQFKGYLDSGMDPGTSDPQGYVEWGDGTTYNVRIIGINHDDLSDGSGKAGLTFQFASLLKDSYRMCASGVMSDWQHSEGRANMNPDDLTQGVSIDGTDSNLIWSQVPSMLQSSLETVRKQSTFSMGHLAYGVHATDDKLFILGIGEVYTHAESSSHPYYPLYTTSAKEGETYAYYEPFDYCACMLLNNYSHAALANADGSTWMRTVSPTDTDRFCIIMKTGSTWDRPARESSTTENTYYGRYSFSPAFCL